MKLLTGVIALSSSFWMFMFIYGLGQISSAAYSSGFYFFPFVLLVIAGFCFFKHFIELDK